MSHWSFTEARAACRVASMAQRAAERAMKHAAREAAEAERRYRVALAQEIVRQHNDEKVAWTVAPDLARGNEEVARLRQERDLAEGVRDAQMQVSWRRAADRKDAQRFADWSMRRNLAEGWTHDSEPVFSDPIGARA